MAEIRTTVEPGEGVADAFRRVFFDTPSDVHVHVYAKPDLPGSFSVHAGNRSGSGRFVFCQSEPHVRGASAVEVFFEGIEMTDAEDREHLASEYARREEIAQRAVAERYGVPIESVRLSYVDLGSLWSYEGLPSGLVSVEDNGEVVISPGE